MSQKKLLPFYRLYSGRRRLTIQEKEGVLKALLSEHAVPEKRQLPHWFRGAMKPVLATAIVACAVLIAFFFAVPHEDEFAVRGDGPPLSFRLQCVSAKGDKREKERCRRGDTLLFKMRPPEEMPYFASFASNMTTDDVIWYYPAKERQVSIRVGDFLQHGVLKEGVAIGPEHVAGTYRVYGIFSTAALSRAQIREKFENDRSRSGDLTVVETKLDVE